MYRALVFGHVPSGIISINAEIAPWNGPVEIVPRGREGQDVDFRQSVGTASNPGKPSQTRVACLECGYFLGHAASRVALFPMTGRRHQLRVHCLHAGFPIIGDGSYARLPPSAAEQRSDATPHSAMSASPASQSPSHSDGAATSADRGQAAAVDLSSVRMMLHAHSLSFTTPSNEKRSKKRQRLLDSMPMQSVHWTAPDPFEGVLLDSRPPEPASELFVQRMGAGCEFAREEQRGASENRS
jgi:23S rRNA-/tRNA-specific pseudouridylate synthase